MAAISYIVSFHCLVAVVAFEYNARTWKLVPVPFALRRDVDARSRTIAMLSGN